MSNSSAVTIDFIWFPSTVYADFEGLNDIIQLSINWRSKKGSQWSCKQNQTRIRDDNELKTRYRFFRMPGSICEHRNWVQMIWSFKGLSVNFPGCTEEVWTKSDSFWNNSFKSGFGLLENKIASFFPNEPCNRSDDSFNLRRVCSWIITKEKPISRVKIMEVISWNGKHREDGIPAMSNFGAFLT